MLDRLPLTEFEELLFWMDRPAYPCTIFVRSHFDGTLDRDAMERSLQTVIRRHPLLRSLVVKKGRNLFWSPVENPQIKIHWQEGGNGEAIPSASHLDLTKEVGIRVWVVQGTSSSEMTLQMHHACVDGGGIHAFTYDLSLEYEIQCGGDSPRLRLPELDATLLTRRGTFGLTKWKLLRILPKQLVGLIGAVQFFGRKPVPLLPSNPAPSDDSSAAFPSQHTRVFSKQLAQALRKAAKEQEVTLNDLLARDLFLAVNEWRAKNKVNECGQWTRMMLPLNMRSKADLSMPAANVVSSVFLDRRERDCEDPKALLCGIRQEMQLIKDLQLGLTFILTLRWLRWLPAGLRRWARQDKCSVSFVFTNLGNILRRSPLQTSDGHVRTGTVVLRKIEAAVPVGPYNNAVFCAHHYARRLTFTMNYDSRIISEPQANDLMEVLAKWLHRSAEPQLEAQRKSLRLSAT